MRDSQDSTETYDAFISHASEDKDPIARPLAMSLQDFGIDVWYDEFELSVGDNLRRSIDAGLTESDVGIVVLSETFFGKKWTEYELDALVKRQLSEGDTILPLWYQIDADDITSYSPALSNLYAIEVTKQNIPSVAQQLHEEITTAEPQIASAAEIEDYLEIIQNEIIGGDLGRIDDFFEENKGAIREIVEAHKQLASEKTFTIWLRTVGNAVRIDLEGVNDTKRHMGTEKRYLGMYLVLKTLKTDR